MPRSGPRQIYQYSKEFQLAAVRLSHVSGRQVQAVATLRSASIRSCSPSGGRTCATGRCAGGCRKRRLRDPRARSRSCRRSSGGTMVAPAVRASTTRCSSRAAMSAVGVSRA